MMTPHLFPRLDTESVTSRRTPHGSRADGSARGPRGARGPGPGGRGPGRGAGRGGWQQTDLPDASDAAGWFAGRLPDGWFDAVDVTVDREEIVVVGTLAGVSGAADAGESEGRLARFRAETRKQRMAVADEAQSRYGRTVSWGARAGGSTAMFTHLAVPVMTRLRQPERVVLDTLVDSGVARSRSDALAWCVRLVGEHADSWLGELREAMTAVDDLRAKGPEL